MWSVLSPTSSPSMFCSPAASPQLDCSYQPYPAISFLSQSWPGNFHSSHCWDAWTGSGRIHHPSVISFLLKNIYRFQLFRLLLYGGMRESRNDFSLIKISVSHSLTWIHDWTGKQLDYLFLLIVGIQVGIVGTLDIYIVSYHNSSTKKLFSK